MIIGVGRGSGLDKTLDSDLERIVSRCMASNPDDVPGIRDLFIWVSNGINRDAQWYKDKMPDAEANKMEEDDNIIKFVHEFIINANTIPDTQEQED